MNSNFLQDFYLHDYSSRFGIFSEYQYAFFGNKRLRYRFETHSHPFASDLARELVTGGIDRLARADTLNSTGGDVLTDSASAKFYSDYFNTEYDPSTEDVDESHPVDDIDFDSNGAYSLYNWELFFHVPLTIAKHLSTSGRYEAAQRWLHLIFDPTDASAEESAKRFWKVKPFQLSDPERIENLLVALSADPEMLGDDEAAAVRSLIDAIEAWREQPFRPHVVAGYRHGAYMWKALFSYLDNLIDWGDSLFRQDTRESINEAAQLYVNAANILGPRPQEVPRAGNTVGKSYNDLADEGLDEFSNTLVDLETALPFAKMGTRPPPTAQSQSAALDCLGQTLYFCIPRNAKLPEYWERVADRLFKIRNSLDIRGIFRQLPLFPPPIDPALLAAATAAGLDVSSVIAGLNQPLPHVRFGYLAQRAVELANEVRTLGGSLLSAIEKQDAEQLAILRSGHERSILELARAARYGQWQESTKAREGVQKTLASTIDRYRYYERLLGTPAEEIEVPELEALGDNELAELQLRTGEPELVARQLDVDIADAADVLAQLAGIGDLHLSEAEASALQIRTSAEKPIRAADKMSAIASQLKLIPDFHSNLHAMGVGAQILIGGGTKISDRLQILVSLMRAEGDAANRQAGRIDTAAGYARREQEWAFQSANAANEITATFKQLRAAQIREFIAKRDYETHLRQIENADEVDEFLTNERRGKTSNVDLYAWMRREVQGLHTRAFQLAFDVAKQAEVALQHELGDPSLTYLRYDYAAGKQGLLAGEKLALDIQRMQVDYDNRNEREYELGPSISLRELNPRELLRLQKTGTCEFEIPEWFLDLHTPGTYFRRITSVALSLPSVTGQHTPIHCRLTLLDSQIRTSPAADGYGQDGEPEIRFNGHSGATESMITTSAINDPGIFETAGPRYLPFERRGAIGRWRLELPVNPAEHATTFDYDSISDAILHMSYTAREGGQQLRQAATTRVGEILKTGPVGRLFDIRREFPNAWQQLVDSAADAGATGARLDLSGITARHFPRWMRSATDPEALALDGGLTASILVPQGTVDAITWAGEDLELSDHDIAGLSSATADPLSGLADLQTTEVSLQTDVDLELWLVVAFD